MTWSVVLAVVRGDAFAGMVSVDDLPVNVAADLSDLVRPICGEILFAPTATLRFQSLSSSTVLSVAPATKPIHKPR